MGRTRPLLALAVGLVALTGCSPTDDDALPSPTPTPTRASVTPAPTSTATPSATPAPTAETGPPTAETISCDTMLDPAVDRELRALNLEPSPKPFTSLGFAPTQAAIECPWGEIGAAAGAADAYYGWSTFAPGERDAYIALVQELGFWIEPSAGGVMLVAPPEQYGGGDPLDFMVTDEWVAFGPAGQVDDIVWTR